MSLDVHTIHTEFLLRWHLFRGCRFFCTITHFSIVYERSQSAAHEAVFEINVKKYLEEPPVSFIVGVILFVVSCCCFHLLFCCFFVCFFFCFLLSPSVYLSSQYHDTYTIICIFVRFTFCFFLLYSHSHVNTRPALHNAHTFFAYNSTRYLVKYTLSPIHSNTYKISFSQL